MAPRGPRWCRPIAVLTALSASSVFAGDPPPVAPPAQPSPAAPPAFEGATSAEWTPRLASDDLAVRRKAAYALWSLGPAAAAAAPSLAKALADADAYVRDTSFRAIERLGADAKPAVAPLAALLGSDREEVRQSAASLLVKLGPLAADAVPALTAALESEDAKVRELAAAALGNAGPAGSPAWDALGRLLDDDAPDVVTQAVGALARVDPPRALEDPRPKVRVEAMTQIGSTPAGFRPALLDTLLARLKDPSRDVRAWSANILGTALLRTNAADWRGRVAAPLVELAKREPDEQVLCQIAYAFGRLPDASAESVPLMIEWTKSRDSALRGWTVTALGELAGRARLALPRLLDLAADSDADVAARAVSAVASVGRGDPAVAPALRKAMHGPTPQLARAAVDAVRSADSSVVSAVLPDLLDVATDSKAVEWLRGAAASALVAVQAPRAAVVERLGKAIASESAPPPGLLYAVACLTDPPSRVAIDGLVAAALGDAALARSRAGDAFADESGPAAGRSWKAGVVATLTTALEDPSAVRRLRAAEALKWFHGGAASAVPSLERAAAKDADEAVRKAAAEAITWIRP